MKINLVWTDPTPDAVKAAIQAGADALGARFTNPITTTIQIGWGESGGQPLPPGVLASASPYTSFLSTYTALTSAMKNTVTSVADDNFVHHLAATDPLSSIGLQRLVPAGMARALGLAAADGAGTIDGRAGFSSSYNWWIGPDALTPYNAFNLKEVAIHELSHAIGRIPSAMADGIYDGATHTLDVTRTSTNPYYSVDGGASVLKYLDTSSRSDFAGSDDIFSATGHYGPPLQWSAADNTVPNTIGFTTSDTIAGTLGQDTIVGSSNADTIVGLNGNDALYGGGGNDTILGGGGNDILSGSAGVDAVYGGLGDDTIYTDNSADVVVEKAGEGSDTVWASANYTLAGGTSIEFLRANNNTGLTLTGNELPNTMAGGAGNDVMSGGSGNDVLNGNDGNDTLTGGAGNDTLYGKAGADVFKFGAGFGADTVTDFCTGGTQDWINISGLGITAATFPASVHLATLGTGTKITFSGITDSLIVSGVPVSALTTTDFRFAA